MPLDNPSSGPSGRPPYSLAAIAGTPYQKRLIALAKSIGSEQLYPLACELDELNLALDEPAFLIAFRECVGILAMHLLVRMPRELILVGGEELAKACASACANAAIASLEP